ncbi:hypothetical protein GCM10009037_19750 [Halarchaeum grantii]|uniref:Uncharacterized protein n=2 Tax=Halarchaeum grantii TaxID=1193105 RepID=A0A830EVZ4_9EURY|nr:hypothetical protein GCM10009037_19750 [Halarchaeum grantii]
MIPPFLVSSQPPALEQGVGSHQASPELYQTAYWINSYSNEPLVRGDIMIKEVITPVGGVQIKSGVLEVKDGKIPRGMFVYRSENRVQYSGWVYGDSTRVLTVDSSELSPDLSRSKVYTTGETKIYSGNSTPSLKASN